METIDDAPLEMTPVMALPLIAFSRPVMACCAPLDTAAAGSVALKLEAPVPLVVIDISMERKTVFPFCL
jgi:hypothetical protein